MSSHPAAQYGLGILYSHSGELDLPPLPATALHWLAQAAAAGHSAAQNTLGIRYARGIDVIQDYDKAREYWEQSAAQGDPEAQTNLGILYREGMGVTQDPAAARAWFEKAAAQDFTAAKEALQNLQ